VFAESAERLIRRGLIVAALAGLLLGLAASLSGNSTAAQWLWAAGTLPVDLRREAGLDRVRQLP
jgi:hypothetical protein